MCAQIESLEKSLVSPRLPGKGAAKNSRTKSPESLVIRKRRDADVTISSKRSGPKLQSVAAITPKSPTASHSKGVDSRFSPAMRDRGRRTEGVPNKPVLRRYIVVDSSDRSSERGRGHRRAPTAKISTKKPKSKVIDSEKSDH